MLTQLLNHVPKEQCSRGEYTKKRGPLRGKFIDGGLFGALNRVGAWTGAGAGVEKTTSRPGPLTAAGRGIEAGACRFRGPKGPITNTNCSIQELLEKTSLAHHLSLPTAWKPKH